MKRKNLLWIGLMIGMEIVLIYLLSTGNINDFLHPKMNKFILFTIAMIGLLIGVEIYLLFNNRQSLILEKGAWIFSVPLAMILIFQPNSMDATASAGNFGSIDFSNPILLDEDDSAKVFTQESPRLISDLKEKQTRDSKDFTNIDPSLTDENSRKNTEKEVMDAIERVNNGFVQSQDHVPEVLEINPRELDYINIEGEKFKEALKQAYTSQDPEEIIEIMGFAFKQENMQDNQISIARLLMACCAQDTTIAGLLINMDGFEDKIEEGKWFTVKGHIDQTTIEDEITGEHNAVPILNITELIAEEAPISPYIYP